MSEICAGEVVPVAEDEVRQDDRVGRPRDRPPCPRCGRPLPWGRGGGMLWVPRQSQELCSYCLTGHRPDWAGDPAPDYWSLLSQRRRRWYAAAILFEFEVVSSVVAWLMARSAGADAGRVAAGAAAVVFVGFCIGAVAVARRAYSPRS
jgi:hypothetical protein